MEGSHTLASVMFEKGFFSVKKCLKKILGEFTGSFPKYFNICTYSV